MPAPPPIIDGAAVARANASNNGAMPAATQAPRLSVQKVAPLVATKS
jgi:hypothetical protein